MFNVIAIAANIEKDKPKQTTFYTVFAWQYYCTIIFAYFILFISIYNLIDMEISKDQFPVVVQAFEINGNKEFFVAEQVVNSQSEVETFSARYAGKVLKARALNSTEVGQHKTVYSKTRKSPVGTILLIILIILIILIAIGYYTGWIQRTFGMNM